MEDKCEMGCKVYHGGELAHHKDCVFYPESRTEMYDKSIARIKELELAMQEFVKGMRGGKYTVFLTYVCAHTDIFERLLKKD